MPRQLSETLLLVSQLCKPGPRSEQSHPCSWMRLPANEMQAATNSCFCYCHDPYPTNCRSDRFYRQAGIFSRNLPLSLPVLAGQRARRRSSGMEQFLGRRTPPLMTNLPTFHDDQRAFSCFLGSKHFQLLASPILHLQWKLEALPKNEREIVSDHARLSG